jgi:hypothetical protein
VLAVVMTWPALADPAHAVPGGRTDPLILVWEFSWAGHALLNDPARLFDGNAFYPEQGTLALSDSMVGYAPIAWLGSGTRAALVHYNVLYVLAAFLAVLGGYALARQFGSGRVGAMVAGAAFGFAPWRIAHDIHLHVLSTGGVALSLAMLARGHGLRLAAPRRGRARPWWAAAGWLVASWQVTIGWAVGLPFAYLLMAIAAAAVAWLVVGRRRQRRLTAGILAADVAGLALFAGTVVAMGQPYLALVERSPEVARSVAQVAKHSPPFEAFFAAPTDSVIWGWFAKRLTMSLGSNLELRLLPGMTLITLAIVGLVVSKWSVRSRLVLVGFIALTVALGMGIRFPGEGRYTFLWLWEHAPGWAAIRTPGRLVIFTTLALSILAAGAVGELVDRGRRGRHPALAVALLAALPALVLIEGAGRVPLAEVPKPPAAFRAAQGPIVVLPCQTSGESESLVMYWSVDRFVPVANGYSGGMPLSQRKLVAVTASFPDARSVTYLQSRGIRSAVVLRARSSPAQWARAANADITALPLRRQEIGGDLLYLIDPPPPERDAQPKLSQ